MGRAMPGSIVNGREFEDDEDRKSTRLNSSHGYISYAVFCLKKKKKKSAECKREISATFKNVRPYLIGKLGQGASRLTRSNVPSPAAGAPHPAVVWCSESPRC